MRASAPNITTIGHKHVFITHLIMFDQELGQGFGANNSIKLLLDCVTVYEIDFSFQLLPECMK